MVVGIGRIRMESKQLTTYAARMFTEGFRNAYYIGRYQIHTDLFPDRRPHKFFYIGYRDMFGVAMPEARGYSFQVWGRTWVIGRSEKLDAAVKNAMRGRFPEVRHNIQLDKRAKHDVSIGWRKPEWFHTEKKATVTQADQELPLRGQKNRKPAKRQRRQLKRKRRKLLV